MKKFIRKSVLLSLAVLCVFLTSCSFGELVKNNSTISEDEKTKIEETTDPSFEDKKTEAKEMTESSADNKKTDSKEAEEYSESSKKSESKEAEEYSESSKKSESKEADEIKFPFNGSEEFMFSSGAGAWATIMIVNQDGSFEGEFHDTNMGETGDGYPNGTVYSCIFSGKFVDIKKINEYSYSMQLSGIKLEKEADTKEIKDGVLYNYSDPYGLEDGKEFVLYMPDTPVEGLSEEFLSWWPGRFSMGEKPKTLSSYGILNKATGQGFFTYSE